MTNKTKKGASCFKTIAIIVAAFAAAAAVAFAVYKLMQKKKLFWRTKNILYCMKKMSRIRLKTKSLLH